MKIGINAISIRKGGGVVVLGRLLSNFVRLHPEHQYFLTASEALAADVIPQSPAVTVRWFPEAKRSYTRMIAWHLVTLPALLEREQIDVFFSFTPYLPGRSRRISAVLVQDANYFSDEPGLWDNLTRREQTIMRLKQLWTYRTVRIADRITVQTQVMSKAIASRIPSARERISVIPHGPGFLEDVQCAGPRRARRTSEVLEICYVAIYRNHKNFRVLLDALRILKRRGIPARLHLTLGEQEGRDVLRLMAYAGEIGAVDMIVNHGELSYDGVSRLYRSVDVLVHPSVCESFGFAQIEAMAFGLPVLASDTSVHREVCARAARYFPPHDAHALALLLEDLYGRPEERTHSSNLSLRRARDFSWEASAESTLRWLCGSGGGASCAESDGHSKQLSLQPYE